MFSVLFVARLPRITPDSRQRCVIPFQKEKTMNKYTTRTTNRRENRRRTLAYKEVGESEEEEVSTHLIFIFQLLYPIKPLKRWSRMLHARRQSVLGAGTFDQFGYWPVPRGGYGVSVGRHNTDTTIWDSLRVKRTLYLLEMSHSTAKLF